MSGKVSKTIETSANVAIILVALVAGAVLVKRHFLTKAAPAAERVHPPTTKTVIGTKLALQGVDWTKSRQTLVLALAKACHFCSESAPFYQKLAGETLGRDDLRLIALFPREMTDEARGYLDELGVAVSEIKFAPLDAIGTRGTPTLVLVDSSGIALESWLGRLSPEKESEILDMFKCETCD